MNLHPASFIDAADTIEAAGHRMRTSTPMRYSCAMATVGIITGMNLAKGVVLKRMPIDAPVGPLTHFDVVSLASDDFVYSRSS